jgi:hypothetical protein
LETALIDFLTSPGFTAFANAIQVLGVIGIGWTVYRMGRDRQTISIWAECEDGRRKAIGKIPRRVLTRAEVTGWISMKAGRPRLDFTKFNPDYDFPGRQVVVPMTAADFELLLQGDSGAAVRSSGDDLSGLAYSPESSP